MTSNMPHKYTVQYDHSNYSPRNRDALPLDDPSGSPCDHPSPQLKRHLDRFSRFRRVRGRGRHRQANRLPYRGTLHGGPPEYEVNSSYFHMRSETSERMALLLPYAVRFGHFYCKINARSVAVPLRPQDGTACFSHRTLHQAN